MLIGVLEFTDTDEGQGVTFTGPLPPLMQYWLLAWPEILLVPSDAPRRLTLCSVLEPEIEATLGVPDSQENVKLPPVPVRCPEHQFG